jgi:hypothetical protein
MANDTSKIDPWKQDEQYNAGSASGNLREVFA